MNHLLDTIINGPAHYTYDHHLGRLSAGGVVLVALMLEVLAVYLVAAFLLWVVVCWRQLVGAALRALGVGRDQSRKINLHLSFPARTFTSAEWTAQLHSLLSGLVPPQGFWQRLAAGKPVYSFEIVSTKSGGIKYVVVVPEFCEDEVIRAATAFMPGMKVSRDDDYSGLLTGNLTRVVEMKLASDYVLPFQHGSSGASFTAHLTGQMTKLQPGELAAVQIVVSPVTKTTHPVITRRAQSVRRSILDGGFAESQVKPIRTNWGRLGQIFIYPFRVIVQAVLVALKVCWALVARTFGRRQNGALKVTGAPGRLVSDLGQLIQTKLEQPLYECSIRIVVKTSSEAEVKRRVRAMSASFAQFASTRQSLVAASAEFGRSQKSAAGLYADRKIASHLLSNPTVISGSELAVLYRFPDTSSTDTENLVTTRSRSLPTPLSLKGDAQLDVVVGVSDDNSPIGLTLDQRRRHNYIIGKTGTGKTTLITNMIYQDMLSGKGLAVLDPHGDMFTQLLRLVPKTRTKDVVVFDPADREFPVALNLLDPGIEFSDIDERNERITSGVIAVFMRLATPAQWGPRMEHVLRSVTQTALQLENPSLYTLQRLLTDKRYQREVSGELTDPILKQFWEKEFRMMGSMQMSSVTAPLTHRLGHFITAMSSRRILLQGRTTIRVADIMNEGKILLVNLSKGEIGEDQSRFYGTILTAFIWMAGYQRSKIPESSRHDFFVYVDEFQNFATPDFGAIVSEGRKYRLNLTVSHQSIAQIEDKSLVKLVAGNAATIISFGSSPEDEQFILPFMAPEVLEGSIVNLTPHHFFIKTSSVDSEAAFSGMTVKEKYDQSSRTAEVVRRTSNRRYATTKADADKRLEKVISEE